MKKIGIGLLASITLVFGLSGCRSNPVMYQQFTSADTGCKTDEVKISGVQSELNSTEKWTATCEGKTYDCTYHSSAGLDCTEVEE